MAIISAGYDGTVDEVQFASMIPKAGASEYGVDLSGDFAVSAVAGQDRTISVAPGKAWGHSVVDAMDINDTRALTAPGSGSRYDMIVIRRDWQPPGGATTIEVIEGGATKVSLPARNTGQMGVIDDQPIALVRVDAGSTTIGEIIDLRCWARNGGVTAKSDLALQYLGVIGAVVEINNIVYRVKPEGTVIESRLDEQDQHFSSLVMAGGMNLKGDEYTTIWNMKAGSGHTQDGITFSGGVGTVNRSGLYEATGQITFPTTTQGGFRAVSLTVNGSLNRTFMDAIPNGPSETLQVWWSGRLNAGDTIALQGYQAIMDWMNLAGTSDLTRWSIRRIGR